MILIETIADAAQPLLALQGDWLGRQLFFQVIAYCSKRNHLADLTAIILPSTHKGSFIGHKGCCWDIKLSSTGHRAISGSADFSAKVWDATDGSCLLTLPHNHIVKSVDLNNDGTKAVTGGHEKKLRLWDIKALLEQQQSTLEGQMQQNGDSSSSTTTPKASSSAPANLPSKEFLRDDGSSAHDGNIKSVIWDEVNNQIISAGEDKAIRFWDADTMKCLHTINTTEPITSLERNHDDKRSISLTHGKTVEFIDPQT